MSVLLASSDGLGHGKPGKARFEFYKVNLLVVMYSKPVTWCAYLKGLVPPRKCRLWMYSLVAKHLITKRIFV